MINLNCKSNIIISIFFYILYILTWAIDAIYFNVVPTYSALLAVVSLSFYLAFLRKLPFNYYITVVLFSFFTQYLGAMFLFYEKIPIYDTIFHFSSGFLLVWLSDYFYDFLIPNKKYFNNNCANNTNNNSTNFANNYKNNTNKYKNKYKNNYTNNSVKKYDLLRLAFCFFAACACAGLWEILEFCADKFLHLHTQYGLDDTMIDIIAGCLGAAIMTGILYVKNKDK